MRNIYPRFNRQQIHNMRNEGSTSPTMSSPTMPSTTATTMPTSYKTLDQALMMIYDAVQGEREDELFYDYLISVAPTQGEKAIITSIRDDERKHNQMFRRIYQNFTGQQVPEPKEVNFVKPKSYIEGVKEALFGELGAVERYRDIRAGLPTEYYRDAVFEILTDELKHADKYNYILNLNK